MGSKHGSDIRGRVPLYIYPMLAHKGMEYARLSHTPTESVEYEFEDRLQKLKASLAQASGISTSGSEGRIREDDLIVEDEAENSIPDLQRSRP